jgi:phosphinothricin acetyltransferase
MQGENMPSSAPTGVTIRAATRSDAPAIAAIYNHYVAETVVTFEEQTVTADELALRLDKVQTAALPWLVAEEQGQLLGYAYAGPWHVRSAYRFSAEISVYLDHRQQGRGLGSRLYAELLPLLKARGLHVVIGGIALPNAASVALHERLGMRKVAHFEQVGFKFDRWIDVGYWQLTL